MLLIVARVVWEPIIGHSSNFLDLTLTVMAPGIPLPLPLPLPPHRHPVPHIYGINAHSHQTAKGEARDLKSCISMRGVTDWGHVVGGVVGVIVALIVAVGNQEVGEKAKEEE